ncbi:MAG TPA: cobalamin-dependent protein, partial [Ferruginibacter sp.]|nr:cobalamin-dependent protein [Ferruginibacter sp.]
MSTDLKNKVRLVTAAALFDGHDAAINIMRRILQSKGAEIIHLGHNRSAAEIVECAIEEDVHGIAITSYQGGHVEFFKYMKDLLEEYGCGHIKIFGGGGGTILPSEIEELHNYGITRIYSPDDGRTMGLEGMIEDLIRRSVPNTGTTKDAVPDFFQSANKWHGFLPLGEVKDIRKIARAITLAENGTDYSLHISQLREETSLNGSKITSAPVLGITGTGGAGKSSVTDEIVRRFLNAFADKTVAVISVDPSKKKTGGALLGDRIRMNSISSPRAYMRSLATRESDKALSKYVQEAIDICKSAGYDFIILESAGVGQSDASILDYCNISMYVMTPEYGAPSQLEKINMLDYADVVCINKFDKAGALDALSDVKKQYKRNHSLWNAKNEDLPVVGTIAAQFNDAGINELFERIMEKVEEKTGVTFHGPVMHHSHTTDTFNQSTIIPPKRVRYLSEITETINEYDNWAKQQGSIASQLYKLKGAVSIIKNENIDALSNEINRLEQLLDEPNKKNIADWASLRERYKRDYYEFRVRDKIIKQPLTYKSLSGTIIPKVLLPRYSDWGDILLWQLQENVPGEFPYTGGV